MMTFLFCMKPPTALQFVIPANAGIQCRKPMAKPSLTRKHDGFAIKSPYWIPVFAGMTNQWFMCSRWGKIPTQFGRTMNDRALLMLMLILSCHLSACGQKGPLFIPNKPPPVTTPYPTAPTTSTTFPAAVQPENNSLSDSEIGY